jgi:putative ABC transport system substrate-binding protein
MLKKILVLFVGLYFVNSLADVNSSNRVLILVNQFSKHSALDAVAEGFQEEFRVRSESLKEKIEIRIGNAGGSIPNAVQLARHQAALKPNFMVAIATPSAQANLRAAGNIPTAFVAVTDPIGAGIDSSNSIGISDEPDIEGLVSLLGRFIEMKSIGVIRSHGEISSQESVKKLEEVVKRYGVKVYDISAVSVADVKLAAQKLVEKVDLVYVPKDNLVVSSIDSVIQEAKKKKIPVVSNDPMLSDKGVLLTYGCDYYKSGEELASMLIDLIEGKILNPRIRNCSTNVTKVNQKIAKELEIIIPENLLQK